MHTIVIFGGREGLEISTWKKRRGYLARFSFRRYVYMTFTNTTLDFLLLWRGHVDSELAEGYQLSLPYQFQFKLPMSMADILYESHPPNFEK